MENVIGFALFNEEMGWVDKCPVFFSKEAADIEAAGKCRRHSVIEVNVTEECQPCYPVTALAKCKSCLRFAGYKK